MKFFITTSILLIGLRGCTSQEDLDLDSLIDSTFNTGNTGSQGEETPECQCVPYYQCSTNRTIIENGEGLIDIRLKPETCESYLEVCCVTGKTVTDPITPAPPTQITPTYSTCGQRNTQGVSSLRITGDVEGESQFGEFPWMVAVTSMQQVEGRPGPSSVYQCGGSLISSTVVLTAAHCVNNKTGLYVRAGEWDTSTNQEPLPLQISAVKAVEKHEDFHPVTLHNDVALLVLEKPMEFAPHIRPICLPEQDENMDRRNCVASGWGKDVFGKEGKYQVILKKVEKQLVPRDQCLEALRKTRLGSRFNLHGSFICAGGELGKDTCQGDGGSPLVCPSTTDPNVYVQAGIVAWGIGCGSETPAVYVNVAHFSSWIQNKLNAFSIDPRLD